MRLNSVVMKLVTGGATFRPAPSGAVRIRPAPDGHTKESGRTPHGQYIGCPCGGRTDVLPAILSRTDAGRTSVRRRTDAAQTLYLCRTDNLLKFANLII